MSYRVVDHRLLTCMGCGSAQRVLVIQAEGAEVFPRCEGCGGTDWVDLPPLEIPSAQEMNEDWRSGAIARGDIVETPYGDMTRAQFTEHARVMNAYWDRMRDAMRELDE